MGLFGHWYAPPKWQFQNRALFSVCEFRGNYALVSDKSMFFSIGV